MRQFLMGTFLKWRTIAAISTIFPVLSILALFFVPESPHWLLVKGRYEEAKRSLAWLRGWTSLNDIEQEYESIYEVIVRQPAAQRLLDSGSNQSDCSRQAGLYAKKSFLVPYALVTLTFFIGHFSGKTPLQTYAVQVSIRRGHFRHFPPYIKFTFFSISDFPYAQSTDRQILCNRFAGSR